MWPRLWAVLSSLAWLTICWGEMDNLSEKYTEELLLSPLANGDVLAHFRFTTVSSPQKLAGNSNGAKFRDYHLFPRALGELMEEHSLRELDLSLSRGVWRENLWGYAPKPAPPGAKVGAWFEPDTDVEQAWGSLTNALSGQLCASLNFLDSTVSVSPKFMFQPTGVSSVTDRDSVMVNSSNFRVGLLPKENVCTENLTPWKKLLPCGSKRGLATLLNAAPIHRTRHHALGLGLRHVCPSGQDVCQSPQVEFTQHVTLVFDLGLFQRSGDEGNPRSWSLRSLFGIGLTSSCAVASETNIIVEVTDEKLLTLKPSSLNEQPIQEVDSKKYRVFDMDTLLDAGTENIIANYNAATIHGIIPSPTLSATRHLVGYGQEKGGIVAQITNKHAKPLKIVYLDVVPWYLRLYLSSLVVSTDKGKELKPLAKEFVPGVDRSRPYVLEMVLELPAKSVTSVSIQFEKSLLKWLEYPPDANHGFYVGSAVVSALLPQGEAARKNFTSVPREHSTLSHHILKSQETGAKSADTLVVIYTESLLVNLPTPDFSMPYNVICLACTVVALAFGPLHNITTKTLVIETPTKGDQKNKGIIAKVLAVLLFWKKKEEEKEEEKQDDESSSNNDAKNSDDKKTD